MSRRRATREPAFGSDSFLDVITNLVGIVIIIIVMVIARTRTLPLIESPEPLTSVATPHEPEPDLADLRDQLAESARAVSQVQGELLALLRELETAEAARREVESQLPELHDRQTRVRVLLEEHAKNVRAIDEDAARAEDEHRSLRDRIQNLQLAVRETKPRPPERRALRYHLPVSRPVGEGELFFECRGGRVTFIDLQPMLEQVRGLLRSKGEDLRTRWEVTDSVGPVGAFRLEYVVARERSSPLDNAFGQLPPAGDARFSYGLARWEVVPVWPERGETVEEALAPQSRFRQVVDALNPDHVTLTFFVYEDSFAGFRTLRDHAHARGFVVAGRPLEMSQPIAGSRAGTISRGQ